MTTKKNLTYVIADLHGRHDLFLRAWDSIMEYHHAQPDYGHATVVTLGDYVDRGPDSVGLLSDLIELQGLNDEHSTLIPLAGNHEHMMMLSATDPDKYGGWWFNNGGETTKKGYMDLGAGPGSTLMADHIMWMSTLALACRDNHRVYVHAGLLSGHTWDAQPMCDIGGNTASHNCLWMRYEKDEPGWHHGSYVVHGHSPNKNGPVHFDGRSNYDTLAYVTGRLVVGVFDDSLPGKAIHEITVLGDDAVNWGKAKKVV